MEQKQVRVYTPDSVLRQPKLLMAEMWRDLMLGRQLAWRLAIRDISAMYRQTILGFLWAFILPLANTLTWIFLRSSGVVAVQETRIPYAIYVFSGTILWAIFMESLNAPLQKTSESKSMLSKINFPREAILLSAFYQCVFNAIIKLILLFIGLVALGYSDFSWHLLLFPLSVFSLILVGLTIGLFLTPLGLLYSDVAKGLPLVLQFLMYLTPVVFPIPEKGIMSVIFQFNPVTPLIMTSRDWLTGFPTDFLQGFLLVNLVFFAILFVGWTIYKVAMPLLIERMSS